MTPYYQDDAVTLWHGDCLDVMATMPDASVHAVVTDPPYGLEFMGREWDSFGPQRDPRTAGRAGDGAITAGAGIGTDISTPGGRSRAAFGTSKPSTWRCNRCNKRDQFRNHSPKVPNCDGEWIKEMIYEGAPRQMLAFQAWCTQWAAECLRVLKPGGHLLAFGGMRTQHRLACAIEDAGFEIRDAITWLFGSGFPKSRNLEGEWQGWGTALKPAAEIIVVARKPLAGTVAQNVLAHGTGALNVDGCRVDMGDEYDPTKMQRQAAPSVSGFRMADSALGRETPTYKPGGRWPTNAILDDTAAAELDRQSGELTSGAWDGKRNAPKFGHGGVYNDLQGEAERSKPADSGGASRFFPTFRYEAKAPTEERPTYMKPGSESDWKVNRRVCRTCGKRPQNVGTSACSCAEPDFVPDTANAGRVSHPTVKPLDLMRWLVRLVTPPGGTVLDPFAGSGTTAEACVIEGFSCVTIEREADYLPLILARLTKPIEPVLDLGALA